MTIEESYAACNAVTPRDEYVAISCELNWHADNGARQLPTVKYSIYRGSRGLLSAETLEGVTAAYLADAAQPPVTTGPSISEFFAGAGAIETAQEPEEMQI